MSIELDISFGPPLPPDDDIWVFHKPRMIGALKVKAIKAKPNASATSEAGGEVEVLRIYVADGGGSRVPLKPLRITIEPKTAMRMTETEVLESLWMKK